MSVAHPPASAKGLRATAATVRPLARSMSRKILCYPSTCVICGKTVTLTGRTARHMARKRGYSYCPAPQGCSAVRVRKTSAETRAKQAAAMAARWADPAERERQSAARKVHGHTRTRGWCSPTYSTWRSMLTRCTNPRGRSFKYYGGRGITVCERWLVFDNFLADMGKRPVGKTIDRKDSNGNYEPGNCRWATASEQMMNRRPKAKSKDPRAGRPNPKKLTHQQVVEIRRLVRTGVAQKAVAKTFHVDPTTVSQIVLRKTWKK